MLIDNVMLTEHKRRNSQFRKCSTRIVNGANITKKHEMAQHNVHPAASALTASMWKHGCRTIEQAISNFPSSSERAKRITNSIVPLIVEDLRLYSVTLCCAPLRHKVLAYAAYNPYQEDFVIGEVLFLSLTESSFFFNDT